MTPNQQTLRRNACQKYLSNQTDEGWQEFLSCLATNLGGLIVTLKDSGEVENPRSVDVRIHSNDDRFLLISPKGYGEKTAEDGFGDPVVMEVYEDQLRVIVWSDINQEDPIDIISLEDAREDRREE